MCKAPRAHDAPLHAARCAVNNPSQVLYRTGLIPAVYYSLLLPLGSAFWAQAAPAHSVWAC